jgi:hypothetical protein
MANCDLPAVKSQKLSFKSHVTRSSSKSSLREGEFYATGILEKQ